MTQARLDAIRAQREYAKSIPGEPMPTEAVIDELLAIIDERAGQERQPQQDSPSEGWWPEYCSKHEGWHLQNDEGGTGYLFHDGGDAETACRALNDLERGKLIPSPAVERQPEALRAAAREAFRDYPIPYDPDSTARDAIVDFILSSAGVPRDAGERLAMIKGVPHRWNGVEFIPEEAVRADERTKVALDSASRFDARGAFVRVAKAWETAIGEVFTPEVAAELYESASVRALLNAIEEPASSGQTSEDQGTSQGASDAND